MPATLFVGLEGIGQAAFRRAMERTDSQGYPGPPDNDNLQFSMVVYESALQQHNYAPCAVREAVLTHYPPSTDTNHRTFRR